MTAADGPVISLAAYSVALVCLLGIWRYSGHYYVAMLLPLVNGLFDVEHLPAHLSLCGTQIAISYLGVEGGWLLAQLKGYELACINILTAIAVMAVSRGRLLRRRLALCGFLVVALRMTHALSLYAGAYSAIGKYLEGVSGVPGAADSASRELALLLRGSRQKRGIGSGRLECLGSFGAHSTAVDILIVSPQPRNHRPNR